MDTEIIVASISGFASVIVASASYIQAKKLKFFETLFQRKADAFENFFEIISAIPKTESELYYFCSCSRKTTLYCTGHNKQKIDDLMDWTIKAHIKRDIDGQLPEPLEREFRSRRTDLIISLRDELDDSRSFKFR